MGSNRLMNGTNQRLRYAILISMGWLPVAVFAFYLKTLHVWGRYSPILFEMSGLENGANLRDHIFIFKGDIFVYLFAVPVTLVAVVYFTGARKIGLIPIYILLCAILLLLYGNLHSWGTVGTFLTWTALVDAVTFGLQNTHLIDMYVEVDSRLKLLVLWLGLTAPFVLAGWLVRYRLLTYLTNGVFGAMLVLALGATAVGYSSSMRTTPAVRNFLASSMMYFPQGVRSSVDAIAAVDEKGLVETYRIFGGERAASESRFFGAARGNDLIIYILETGSSRFMDLDKDLSRFKTVKKLSGNSLHALNHFSTFPATSEALFSVFFSVYPPRNYYSTCVASSKIKFAQPFPGIVSYLADAGYETALYLPFNDVVPLDHALHQNLGVSRIYFAQNEAAELGKGADKLALETMQREIAAYIERHQKYVAVFMPQVGHAPWPDQPANRSVLEHGRWLAALQDEWLGQIVALLDERGKLDTTTIVLVGDHGIRTIKEDPEVKSGFIDEYAFKVSSMIYSPGAFRETMRITELTSHVDISPTLLDLFGIDRDRAMEQGASMLASQMPRRMTWFLGNWYFAADAFTDGAGYTMYSDLLDVSFANHLLAFSSRDLVQNDADNAQTRDRIRKFYGLQERWIEKFLCRQG